MERFKSQHGSLVCRELLGHNINDPNDFKTICEKDLFSQLCPKYVETAVSIVEDILTDSSKKV